MKDGNKFLPKIPTLPEINVPDWEEHTDSAVYATLKSKMFLAYEI